MKRIFKLKYYFVVIILLTLIQTTRAQKNTFYNFSVKTLKGEQFNFSQLRGKKVMIVNTASKCSLAGQLKKLQELYEEYGGEDFEIIAFPCNDFGNREPGNKKEISERYETRYDLSFPIMEKIHVKGTNEHEIYKWLTNSQENQTLDSKVTWNFQKFLISKEGQVIESISPLGSPTKNRIIEWLQEDL
jgi:glutathione peroxidase